MESIYESLFSSGRIFSEQVARVLLPEAPEGGPLLILIGPDHTLWCSDEGRLDALYPDREVLYSYCGRMEDGQDPVATALKEGCLVGTELYTEKINAGYLFVYLPGYTQATVSTNMDLIELLFCQMRLVCTMVEKNNQLHHLQLNHLSRTSAVLSKRQS